MQKYVTYEEFGAVGDGVTDDFAAIYAAHEYANANRLTVKADDTKIYYIHDNRIDGAVKTIPIMTSVFWGKARFIIDDTDITSFDGTDRHSVDIFTAVSDYEKKTVTDTEILSKLSGIGEGTKKIDLSLGYPAMLVIYDNAQRVFRRSGHYGPNSTVGVDAQEIIVIDAEGNVDGSTPFMFNYKTLSKLEIVRLDIEPITLEGGVFTTLASRVNAWDPETNKRASYIERGLGINRSFTAVKNVEHYVEGEVTTAEHRDQNLKGAHYNGFFTSYTANDVLYLNCIMSGRRYYGAGTYEFSSSRVNKIRLVGCVQHNFEVKDEEGNTVYSMANSPYTGTLRYWGIGGTNFCKNMEYIDSKLSRFDAHCGLYNGRIINSEMNFMELTGKGELLIENLTFNSSNPNGDRTTFAYLRTDYGCTWDGTITFKNCTVNMNSGNLYITLHAYSNWYYGYPCVYPNLIIDNLKINGLHEGRSVHIITEETSVYREPNLHLEKTLKIPHKNEDGTEDYGNANPIAPPKFIKVVNNDTGYDFLLPKVPFFDATEKVGVTEFEV